MRTAVVVSCVVSLAACPRPNGGADAGPATPVDGGPCAITEPEVPRPRRHTPRWAFEPWISKDISDGPDTYAFVEGFQSRGIPVGVVVIDSPWETNYNTFIPNPVRYPAFGQMIADLRTRGVRVVTWVTQMVNEESFDAEPGGDVYPGEASNFVEGYRCGFYVNNGDTYLWWKGQGAGLDFFDPAARAWWHRQQDALLEMGLAGWKLDFGEDYVTTSTVLTEAGPVTHQQYSEAYYEDYLAYGVHKRGAEEFLTMVRPYDKSYQFTGRFYARPEHAPVGWVGDNRRDWVGLEDALDHMFRSAEAGYVVIGSDVGGYLDRDDQDLAGAVIPFSVENFIRWTALGALTPFMQLHGRANITPWTVPERTDETIAAWKYWATFHHALVPYLYSLAEQAYAGGPMIMRPVGVESSWAGDWRYLLGSALFVAPILDDTGVRDVALPSGGEWFDWWDPQASGHAGGTTLSAYASTPSMRIPLFVHSGSIIPMKIENDVLGFGSAAHASALTLLVYPGADASFTVHDEDNATTQLSLTSTTSEHRVTLSRAPSGAFLRVRTGTAPTGVTAGGAALTQRTDKAALDAATDGWTADGVMTWVKVGASTSEVVVSLAR